MCLNPTLIYNRRFKPNKKNKYKPPKCDDERKLTVPVGCGFCIECRKQKANEWRIRITEELKYNPNAEFVSLNLSNEAIDEIEISMKEKNKKLLAKGKKPVLIEANSVAAYAVRHLLENIRKKDEKSIKHIFFTELGQTNTERIHLHGIIWERERLQLEIKSIAGKNFKISKLLNDKWKYGTVWIGDYCNTKTANYIIKYILKTDTLHPEFVPRVLSSKGIGKNWLNSLDAQKRIFNGKDTIETYKLNNGKEVALPIYYRNKLYTEEQRDKLWTNLLDKETRYVMGHKIDVSSTKGKKEYEECCKIYSDIDARYGNIAEKYKRKSERTIYNAYNKKLNELTKIRKGLDTIAFNNQKWLSYLQPINNYVFNQQVINKGGHIMDKNVRLSMPPLLITWFIE